MNRKAFDRIEPREVTKKDFADKIVVILSQNETENRQGEIMTDEELEDAAEAAAKTDWYN